MPVPLVSVMPAYLVHVSAPRVSHVLADGAVGGVLVSITSNQAVSSASVSLTSVTVLDSVSVGDGIDASGLAVIVEAAHQSQPSSLTGVVISVDNVTVSNNDGAGGMSL